MQDKESKRHLPRTGFSIACFSCGWRGEFCFCLSLFFSRRETLDYLLLWFCRWGRKSCLVDELDKLLWTTTQTVVVIHFRSSTRRLGAVTSVQRGGDPGAAVPVVQLVQQDMDLSLYCSLSDLSAAHSCCLHGHRLLRRLHACFSVSLTPSNPTPHLYPQHTSEFTNPVTLPVLGVGVSVSVCECMFVCVCVAKMYWRTLPWVCFQGYCTSFLFLKGP